MSRLLPPLWNDSFSDRYEIKLFRPHEKLTYWSASISSPDNLMNVVTTGDTPKDAVLELLKTLDDAGIDIK